MWDPRWFVFIIVFLSTLGLLVYTILESKKESFFVPRLREDEEKPPVIGEG